RKYVECPSCHRSTAPHHQPQAPNRTRDLYLRPPQRRGPNSSRANFRATESELSPGPNPPDPYYWSRCRSRHPPSSRFPAGLAAKLREHSYCRILHFESGLVTGRTDSVSALVDVVGLAEHLPQPLQLNVCVCHDFGKTDGFTAALHQHFCPLFQNGFGSLLGLLFRKNGDTNF